MTKIHSAAALAVLCSAAIQAQPVAVQTTANTAAQGTLIIQVHAAANNDGYIDISLLSNEQQFSGDATPALNCRQQVVAQQASCTFDGLKHGHYALFVYHDENDNHALDENFLGAPTEKLAISAIDLASNSSPTFEQSKFGFQAQVGQVFINLQ